MAASSVWAAPRLTDEGLQHLALVIGGSPKIMYFAVTLDENLIDVPAAEIASP
jgi:hypothetical protein